MPTASILAGRASGNDALPHSTLDLKHHSINRPSRPRHGPLKWPASDRYRRPASHRKQWPTSGRYARPTSSEYASSGDNVTITYDANGRVHTVTRDGQIWTYTWSLSGTTLTGTVTDPLSHQWITTADTSKLVLLTMKDPNNQTVTYTPDANGRITKISYPEGNYTQFAYDSRGNVTSTTAVSKTAGTPANIVTSSVYPTSCTNAVTCNKPTSVTDARGNVTSYTYDPTHGSVLTVTQATVSGVAPQTRYSYTALQGYYKNASGSIVASGVPTYKLTGISACRTTASCSGGVDETKTTIGYGLQVAGTANNLLPVSTSAGAGDGSLTATSATAYDIFGNPYTATDALGHITRYRYDADHELVGLIGPDPDGTGILKNRAQRITYNSDGLVTLTEQGTVPSQSDADWSSFVTLQQVATAYDSSDRQSQISAQAGGTTYAVAQYTYDAASRVQCVAQRMNSATFTALPASACTLTTAGSYGSDRITYNTYDSANRLLKIRTGYGVTTANGFPATLQRDEVTYTYSNNGKAKTVADAKNNLTTYVYDGFDRLSQTLFPSPTTPGTSNAADYEQLGYDPVGNIISRRLRDGNSIGYGYDALNRVGSKTPPTGEHAISYAYDNLGHPKTATGANTLTYSWDALGRETSETQAYGNLSYQYDLAGRRTRLTWQDSTYLTYDYDNVGEMTDIKESGSTVLASFTYDDLGQRKTRTLGNGTSTTYGFDANSRLTSVALAGGTNPTTVTLSNYSPAAEIGSRVNSNDAFAWTAGMTGSKAYTINGLNQFATIAGAAQGYDARGNVTSSGGVTYTYTSQNLLTTVSGGYTLAYDPIGRLQEYDVPTATRFVYDGGMISEELNSSGAVLRRYAFGPSGDEPIVWYEGSGTATKRYMDRDERGSITRITDGTGAIIAINSYDEFGIPGPANQGRFGYTGQAWLAEVGLAYYKARIYSPTLGRFLQTDPIGYANGPNWYNYVHGDPINLSDPAGTDDWGDIIVNGGLPDDGFDIDWGLIDFDLGNGIVPPEINIGGGGTGTGSSSSTGQIVVTAQRKNASADTGDTTQLSPVVLGPAAIQEIVVTAQRTKRLGQFKLNMNLPFPLEDTFIVGADGTIRPAAVFKSKALDCGPSSDGQDKQFAVQVFNPNAFQPGDQAVIHDHPYDDDPYPGSGDAQIPTVMHIPNYGISPFGSWVVEPNPGGGVDVRLLSGSWGGDFSPSTFAAPGGNSGGSSSKKAICGSGQ